MRTTFLLRKPVLILFPLSLLVATLLTMEPTPKSLVEPGVKDASLADTLPQLAHTLQLHQLQGVVHIGQEGSSVYYFEYEADHELLIQTMNRLTFSVDNTRVDLQLREVPIETQEHIQALLQDKEIRKYFEVANDKYLTLEFIRGQERHYLLLSSRSERVIHLVEVA